MKAGSQTKILHRVPSGDVGGIRYSLSFRRIVSTPPILVQEAGATPAHSERSQVPSNKRKIVLLVGDSYFDRLDTNKLAKGKQSVFKVAKGGRKIDDVLKHTKTFLDANPDFEVRKLFVCVGTNDIRYCYDKGINHLKTPLKISLHLSNNWHPTPRFLYSPYYLSLPTVIVSAIEMSLQ